MIKNFDLTGWTCFSERRNSKSYMSPDKKWMVKFGTEFTNNSIEQFEVEKQITLKALEVGVKTPKVQDVVQLPDGTSGLIYEYIEGKKSIARAASEDLDNIDYYIKRFAHIAKDMHSKTCDVNKFESVDARAREQITSKDILNERQKEAALKFLDTIEEKNIFIHGDFQPGNFIITKDDEFAIDLSAAAYGNPVYDVSTFYFFLHYLPPEVGEMIFHIDRKYFPGMWRSFVKYYFDTTDEKVFTEISDKYAKCSLVTFFQVLKFIDGGQEFQEIIDNYFDKYFG